MDAGKRKPSNNAIDKWVQKIGNARSSSVERVNSNHWKLRGRNSAGEYTMDVKDHGHSVSYGIPLTPDVEGKNRANFYKETLTYSAKLNGPHIGIENDKVVLTKEDHKVGLGPLGVGRSIRQMHDTHQVVYPEVLKMQKRNGVRFRNRKG